MDYPIVKMVMIPEEEWNAFKLIQEEMHRFIKNASDNKADVLGSNYIIAKEFMAAVKIKRSRFNKLVNTNKIKAIKKGRRIYVPLTEVERYFSDRSIS